MWYCIIKPDEEKEWVSGPLISENHSQGQEVLYEASWDVPDKAKSGDYSIQSKVYLGSSNTALSGLSAIEYFTVDGCEQVNAPVLIAPSGNIDPFNRAFTWNDNACATDYQLFLKLHNHWKSPYMKYPYEDVCQDGTCSVQLPDGLYSGNYSWWVEAINENTEAEPEWSEEYKFQIVAMAEMTQIESISPSYSSDTITLKTTVRNIADAPLPESQVRYLIIKPDGKKEWIPGQFCTGLEPGQSKTYQQEWKIPLGLIGKYSSQAQVFHENVPFDNQSGGKIWNQSIPLSEITQATPFDVDHPFEIISIPLVEDAVSGQQITLNAVIKNNSGVTLPEGQVWFHLLNPDQSGKPWKGGPMIGDLAPNTQQTFSYSWNIPDDDHGTFSLMAQVYKGSKTTLSAKSEATEFAVQKEVKPTFYRDADNDGFGNPNNTINAETVPDGYVSNKLDCNDNDDSIHPDAIEICSDNTDNNCNQKTDEQGCKSCSDYDGDGFFAESGCDTTIDCDDTDPLIHPGSTEIRGDGIDQDCDGKDLPSLSTYYFDADGDGYGDPDNSIETTTHIAGYVSDNTDCNDFDTSINPGALEIKDDGIDQDCDGKDEVSSGNMFETQPQLAAGEEFTLALNKDGTVLSVGNNHSSEINVSSWSDIVYIDAGSTALGLRNNGTVVAVGSGFHNQLDVSSWRNIQQVAASVYYSIGLKTDGTLVATRPTDYGFPNADAALSWTSIQQIDAGYSHAVGLKTDGTVLATTQGNGHDGLSSWHNIQQIAAGGWHTAGLQSNGTVSAIGLNVDGQCNTGSWTNIKEVAAGYSHTVGLKEDGTVVATGSNKDEMNNYVGQCEVSTWRNIVHIAAGAWHTLGLKQDGSVVAVGKNNRGQCDVSSIYLDPLILQTYYADFDDDGYGDPENSLQASTQPQYYVTDNTDCDDKDPSIYPGATEIRGDGIDQNCDGEDSADVPIDNSRFFGSYSWTMTECEHGTQTFTITIGNDISRRDSEWLYLYIPLNVLNET